MTETYPPRTMENPWKLLETVRSPRVGETVGRRRTKTQGRMDSPRFVLTEDKQKSLMNYSHKLSFTSVTRYIFVKQVRLLVLSEDNDFSYPHDLSFILLLASVTAPYLFHDRLCLDSYLLPRSSDPVSSPGNIQRTVSNLSRTCFIC